MNGFLQRVIGLQTRLENVEDAAKKKCHAINELLQMAAVAAVQSQADPVEMLKLASEVYWQVPRVHAATLAAAMDTNTFRFIEAIRPLHSGVICHRCGEPVDFKSRANQKRGPGKLCNRCICQDEETEQVRRSQESFRRSLRRNELAAMTDEQYAATPEYGNAKRYAQWHLEEAESLMRKPMLENEDET